MIGSGILSFLFFLLSVFSFQPLVSSREHFPVVTLHCGLIEKDALWLWLEINKSLHFIDDLLWSKGFPVSLQTVLSLMSASVSVLNPAEPGIWQLILAL